MATQITPRAAGGYSNLVLARFAAACADQQKDGAREVRVGDVRLHKEGDTWYQVVVGNEDTRFIPLENL